MSAQSPTSEEARAARRRAARLPWRRTVRRFGGRPLRAGESTRVLPLIVPAIALGWGGFVLAVTMLAADPPSAATLAGVAALLAAAIVAEVFPMPIEGVSVGGTSLALVFITATAVLYDWRLAAVVGFGSMAVAEVVNRRPPLRAAFNLSLYVIGALAAAFAAEQIADGDLGTLIVATFMAAIAFYVVDIVLLATVIARSREQRWWSVVRAYAAATSGPFLIMGSLAATLVVLWDRSPYAAIVIVGPLLAIAFYQRWLYGALQRVREFDRLKDEFIAVLSHELRTPLTSVYGAAMTLRQQDVAEPTRFALLNVISDESARLARLLDDILWASRLDTGRENTLIQPTEVEPIVDEVVRAARSRVPSELAVEASVEPTLPAVRADSDKLRQILVNLVENAIKYSPDGGRVRVDVKRAGRYAHFSVHDEGLGIPVHEQDRIFDKFHRLDPNMTRGVGGTGLGLYICSQLVDRMNGRIWVESDEGRGSTFTFELPLE